jgi:hypothetical protein
MITRDNLSSVLDMLTEQEINDTMDARTDMVLLTVSGYGYVSLTPSFDYEADQEEAEATGGIWCDKDEFLRLFSESESINPFLIELI